MPNHFPLDTLPPGHTGKILEINCEPSLKQRLLHMGFVRDTAITCIGISSHGSPIAYSLRGCILALRKKDTRHIIVQEAEE